MKIARPTPYTAQLRRMPVNCLAIMAMPTPRKSRSEKLKTAETISNQPAWGFFRNLLRLQALFARYSRVCQRVACGKYAYVPLALLTTQPCYHILFPSNPSVPCMFTPLLYPTACALSSRNTQDYANRSNPTRSMSSRVLGRLSWHSTKL